MVISSDFRIGKHRDDDHEEDAPYFTTIHEHIWPKFIVYEMTNFWFWNFGYIGDGDKEILVT